MQVTKMLAGASVFAGNFITFIQDTSVFREIPPWKRKPETNPWDGSGGLVLVQCLDHCASHRLTKVLVPGIGCKGWDQLTGTLYPGTWSCITLNFNQPQWGCSPCHRSAWGTLLVPGCCAHHKMSTQLIHSQHTLIYFSVNHPHRVQKFCFSLHWKEFKEQHTVRQVLEQCALFRQLRWGFSIHLTLMLKLT